MTLEYSSTLDPQAVARLPTQQRAKDRFENVLKEAESVLVEQGLSGFSIPVLAERLGYTRGSIYAFFPTPYAILNELVSRYLADLESVFINRAADLFQLPWREAIRMVVEHAVAYHNSHPAARLLILSGAVTDDSYRAQEQTIKRLGDLARTVWTQKGIVLPIGPPDVTTLSTDIGVACFRRSYFEHGTITPEYKEAAVQAMTGFLAPYVEMSIRKNAVEE